MEFKNMDKYEHINDLPKEGSFRERYQKKIIEFGTTHIQRCNSKTDLNYNFNEYSDLLLKISDLSIEYFNDLGEDDRAETAIMTANTYINRISAIYLNLINQKLHKLETIKSIRLARYSIWGAIISISLTICITLWQNYSSQEQKDNIQKIKTNINDIKQQINSDSIRFDTIQSSINKLIEQNDETENSNK